MDLYCSRTLSETACRLSSTFAKISSNSYVGQQKSKEKGEEDKREAGAFRIGGLNTLVRKAAWNQSGSDNLRALTKTKMMCLQCARFLTKSGQVHLNPRQQSPKPQKAQKDSRKQENAVCGGLVAVRRNLRNIHNIKIPRTPQHTKIFTQSTILAPRPFKHKHPLHHHTFPLDHDRLRRTVAVAFQSLLLAALVCGGLAFARGGGFLCGWLFGFWRGRSRNGFREGDGGDTVTALFGLETASVLGRRRRIHLP
jgi:hypothetical protein